MYSIFILFEDLCNMAVIEHTDITIEWLTKVLQQDNNNIKLKSWKITKCCSGGGFLSNIVAIELQWDRQCELPTSIIVKVTIIP